MNILLVTAILAFGASSVLSKHTKFIVAFRCSSTRKWLLLHYNTVHCPILEATPDQRFYVKISNQRYPYTCNKVNCQLVYDQYNNVYLRVKNGCDAYFTISGETSKGSWSGWSDWSTCSKDCHITRSRKCSTGNDADCYGDAEESRICSGGDCQSKVPKMPLCGVAGSSASFRVIGGTNAGKCQFPWMVLVYNRIKRLICGGTIVDDTHVLTAAHCVTNKATGTVYPANYFLLLTGSAQVLTSGNGRRIRKVQRIIAHKDYISNELHTQNDISIMRLSESIKFDSCHRPICLSNGSRSVYDHQGGYKCDVMGWGRVSNFHRAAPKNMKWLKEKPVDNKYCKQEYIGSYSKKTFCGTGRGPTGVCNGDSGGPFVCKNEDDGRYYQYGIVSLGKAGACGVLSALYVSINAYLDWINDALRKLS